MADDDQTDGPLSLTIHPQRYYSDTAPWTTGNVTLTEVPHDPFTRTLTEVPHNPFAPSDKDVLKAATNYAAGIMPETPDQAPSLPAQTLSQLNRTIENVPSRINQAIDWATSPTAMSQTASRLMGGYPEWVRSQPLNSNISDEDLRRGIDVGRMVGGLGLSTTSARFLEPEAAPLGAPNIIVRRPIFNAQGMPIRGKAFDTAAEEAKATVAAYPKGYGPLDLSRIDAINTPQFELPRYIPPRGVSPRLQDALNNNNVINGVADSIDRGVAGGMDKWYHTEPIRYAWEQDLGAAEHAAPFKLHMDLQSAASPRSRVPVQLRNGSWLYMHAMQGRPLPPKGPDIYPYGHLAADLHRDNFDAVMGPGWDVIKNPKPPSYSQNLQGNLMPATIDTHAFRNIGMRTGDPRFLVTNTRETIPLGREVGPNSAAAKYGEWGITKPNGDRIVIYRPQALFNQGRLSMQEANNIPAFWEPQPNNNEYAAAENLYRLIGEGKGLRTADAQAAGWAGGGELTGLGTRPDRTFPELMNEQIMYTSHLRGISPGQALRDLIRGRKPLLGIAGVGGPLGLGMWEHENHLPIERQHEEEDHYQ
jgi:hypothetical protein